MIRMMSPRIQVSIFAGGCGRGREGGSERGGETILVACYCVNRWISVLSKSQDWLLSLG